MTPGFWTVAFVAGPGFVGGMPSPSASPVQVEWFQNEFTAGVWAESDGLDIGLQVSSVPEPGSYSMLALGLLAVGAAVRRRA